MYARKEINKMNKVQNTEVKSITCVFDLTGIKHLKLKNHLLFPRFFMLKDLKRQQEVYTCLEHD